MSRSDILRLTFQLTAHDELLEVRAWAPGGEGKAEATIPPRALLGQLVEHDPTRIPSSVLISVGQTLYQCLMVGDIAKLASSVLQDGRQSKQPVLFELRFDADQVSLAQYPWEMIANDFGEFLVRDGLVDVTRYITYPQPPPTFDVMLQNKLFLRIISQPSELQHFTTDGLSVERIETLRHVTFEQLLQKLLIERMALWGLQFHGHGALMFQCYKCDALNVLDAKSCRRCGASLSDAKQVGALAFERNSDVDWITTEEFGSVLYNAKVQLVLLLSCETARVGDRLIFSGLAPGLILAGVPAVVGMQYPVLASFANIFSKSFYTALFKHNDVLDALRTARRMNIRGAWYCPVLYLRHQKTASADEPLKSIYHTRNVDTAVPAETQAGVDFLTWLWIRRPETKPLTQGQLREELGVPELVPISTRESKADMKFEPVECPVNKRRKLRRGAVEVKLSSSYCDITPESIKLFVDEHLDAPAAIFTARARKAGRASLIFSVWQDGGQIASVTHHIQVMGSNSQPKAIIQTGSRSVPVQDIGTEIPRLSKGGIVVLHQGTLLQNRYRILRQIGGGGMGVVYLAEDTRLAGRRCAIKEMSPEQVAAQDRNWAIQAFQQEAQMLAHLNHPGLTAVTDFLPEEGNWYLVMDYAEGETLQSRLERSPGGRLPLDEALNVTHQLCNVLEYLHGQRPPVVFRDLKPGNVMLTPEGEVKLIDFGIARFFKAGQTRDTVSLGTPGYAAPELYGSRGQSDPRTDVYSLGTLLLQMVTGYDPAAAVTPFPLPTPESLMRGLPAHVEEVISRATRVQPELRHQSTIEFRQALFPPTWVLPPPGMPTAPPYVPTAPQAQARPASGLGKRIWIGLGIAGILLIGVCTLVLGIWIVPMFFPTPTVPSSPAAMSTSTPTVTPVATEPPTTLVPTSSPAIEPATEMALHWISIGRSAQGRDLTAAVIGDARGAAVVVVGSIQGDQPNTRDLVEALIGNFERDSARIPANVAFHFIPTINPDGNAASTRRNANNVDLNRNWDTFDWTPDPEQPEGVVRGAGGSRRNSEPETQSLANYLLSLQRQNPDLRLVLLHSSQRITSGGHVYPGYTSSGLEPNAIALAQRYASVTGYALKEDWAPYETTGELIAWCAEEGIEAIDVVIPGASSGSDSNLRRTTMEALLEIARFP